MLKKSSPYDDDAMRIQTAFMIMLLCFKTDSAERAQCKQTYSHLTRALIKACALARAHSLRLGGYFVLAKHLNVTNICNDSRMLLKKSFLRFLFFVKKKMNTIISNLHL